MTVEVQSTGGLALRLWRQMFVFLGVTYGLAYSLRPSPNTLKSAGMRRTVVGSCRGEHFARKNGMKVNEDPKMLKECV
jgi:hypothetical protein